MRAMFCCTAAQPVNGAAKGAGGDALRHQRTAPQEDPAHPRGRISFMQCLVSCACRVRVVSCRVVWNACICSLTRLHDEDDCGHGGRHAEAAGRHREGVPRHVGDQAPQTFARPLRSQKGSCFCAFWTTLQT
jgi:hypothetical protein